MLPSVRTLFEVYTLGEVEYISCFFLFCAIFCLSNSFDAKMSLMIFKDSYLFSVWRKAFISSSTSVSDLDETC